MELAVITAKQVVVLFMLILAGFICTKSGAVKSEGKKALSDLLVYYIVPAMIIDSYITEFSSDKAAKLVQSFSLSFFAIIIGMMITLIIGSRLKGNNAPIIKFACIFSNAGYMGFPLVQAVFGGDSLLYASAYLTVFNILLWTVGYILVSKNSDPRTIIKSIITTPVIPSVIIGLAIFILRIHIPNVFQQALGYAGSMNTPISMFITGMLIAENKISAIIKNKLIAFVIILRMIVLPLVCLGLFALFNIRGEVADIVLLLEACPCAAITSVFAVKFNYEEDIAGGAVVITTMISVLTLPVFAYLITNLI